MKNTGIVSYIHSLWLALTAPENCTEDAEYKQTENNNESAEEQTMRREIAHNVCEILEEQRSQNDDEDFELQRIICTFKLLRKQGYTLRIIPGTPEENAPVYDFEKDEIIRPAA